MKRWVAIVCIVVGIGMVSYQVALSTLVMPYKIDKVNDVLENDVTSQDIEQNIKELQDNDEDVFDFSDVKSLESTDFNPKIDKKNVVGWIKIPSVDVNLPILYGATHENMLTSAGTMKKSQTMGEGNYALAGHNARNPNILFAPIRRMENGDKIYITDKKKVYEYRMVKSEVVMPDRVDVINDVEGKKLITLVSCYSQDGSDRIIITGKLENVTDYK